MRSADSLKWLALKTISLNLSSHIVDRMKTVSGVYLFGVCSKEYCVCVVKFCLWFACVRGQRQSGYQSVLVTYLNQYRKCNIRKFRVNNIILC